MELLNHIHIFKTNIKEENLSVLQSIFSAVRSVLQWNVDIEDCDHVLRVISYELSENDICQLVSKNGFVCEILD